MKDYLILKTSIQVKSLEELNELVTKSKVVVAGFFNDENSDNALTFKSAANVDDRNVNIVFDYLKQSFSM